MATWPMPDHESSQNRSARSARSDDGCGKPGEAEGCSQESAALVEHGYSITWSARPRTDGGMVRPSVLATNRISFTARLEIYAITTSILTLPDASSEMF